MSIGCSERTTQPETIFFVFLYAKIYLLLVFLLSFSVVVLLPFSMIFKFNFGLNFNIIRFYLNCKISFGFLPIKQKSLGLLELASKMQEIWPCIEKVMVKWKLKNDINLQKLLIKDVVKKYFYDGYRYLEIINFLSKYHEVSILLRRLYRFLRNLGLFRRKQHSNLN